MAVYSNDKSVDLSISIVNTSNWQYIEPCIDSIIKNVQDISYEILVVDNLSNDGSAEKIKEKFPEVKLTINQSRYGFAKNNNINIKQASGNYILLLNDDTLILSNTLEKALPFFEKDPKIGIVGCKMINPDGTLQRASARKFRTLLSEFIIETGLFRIFPQSFMNPQSEFTEIDIPSEAGMIVRRETINEVGLLDEQFFMFGEGPEWCRRIKRAGWKIYYLETCPVIHFGGITNKRSSVKMYVQFYKSTYLFFQKDSQLKGTIYRFMILVIFLKKRFIKRFLSLLSQKNAKYYSELKPYYDGLLDFLLNRFNEENYPFPI